MLSSVSAVFHKLHSTINIYWCLQLKLWQVPALIIFRFRCASISVANTRLP